MKILHIAYFGKFGKVTGIVDAVSNLAHKQQELGHQVKIIIPFHHPLADDETIFFARSFHCAISLIKTYSPDIVVFNGFYFKYQISLSCYLKLRQIPYILVFHGGASADNAKKNRLKKIIANITLFNRFVRGASRVIYLSENEKEKSIFSKQNAQYSIIPNGVNVPNILPTKVSNHKIKIIYLSRLDWYGKGLDILCNAIEILYAKGYEDRLQFCFYGPKQSAECDKLFQFGKFSEYCGYVTGDDKDKAFRDANIFILPSRSEGMPLTVLEALSYGVPCIVTRETNMADLVERNNCGWVVNLSALHICNMIEAIMEKYPAERESLSINAVNTARQFDWNTIAKLSVNIYNDILKQRQVLQ